MVYLIHFEKKYKHSQHYLGFVEGDLEQRLKRHRSGTGAKLLKVITDAGINWSVVRVWEDADRTFERKLKNRKNTPYLCPLCRNAENH